MPGKFIMCHGLPGSGKSTWAEEKVRSNPDQYVRVNRDDIRTTLFGPSYHTKKPDQKKEQEVTRVQENLIKENLRKGKTVIDDNTNLNQRFMLTNINLAKNYGAEISQEYFDVPVEECKKRNEARGKAGGRRVPDYVIDNMAKGSYGVDGRLKEFRLGERTVFAYDKAGSEGERLVEAFNKEMEAKYPILSTATLNFDMDGTLVDTRANSDRNMYEGDGERRNFDKFHTESEFDPPNQDVLDIALQARDEGLTVTVTTARSDDFARPTINWLIKIGVPVTRMWMRKAGDYRSDYEVKKEILKEVQASGLTFAACVDDNPMAIKSWIENEILVTQVPFHKAQKYDPDRQYEKINVENPLKSGFCIRCGSPLKNGGTIGPKCRLK